MQVSNDNVRDGATRAPTGPGASARARTATGDDIAVDTAVAFQMLMASLRSSGRILSKQQPAASPNQMFEPNKASPHEARMDALEAQDRESRKLGSGPGQPDPTDMKTRREAAERTTRSDEFTDRTERSSSDKPVRVSSSPDYRTGAERVGRSSVPRQFDNVQGRSSSLDASNKTSEARDRAPLSTLTTVRAEAAGESAGRGAAGVRPMALQQALSNGVSGQRTSSVTMADRIGQIIATGRVDDGGLSRAAAGGSMNPSGQNDGANTARGNRPTAQAGTDGGGKPPLGARGAPASEFAELVKSIRHLAGSRRSSARLRLDPPALGRVTVDVRLKDNDLQISVRADSNEATAVLRHRADMLRAALEHYGIHIERFDIELNTTAGNEAGHTADYGQSELPPSFSDRSDGSGRGSGGRAPPAEHALAVSADSVSDLEWHGVGASCLDIRV